MSIVDARRITEVRSAPSADGPVLYWMIRDQRAEDNWALLHAQDLALQRRSPLAVVFTLPKKTPEASLRKFTFMIEGLKEVEHNLRKTGIPLVLLAGSPAEVLGAFIEKQQAAVVVTDFSPLREYRAWQTQLASKTRIAIIEVDAHNIVPCRIVSQKQEYAAYTLRPRIQRLLGEFLTDIPALRKHPHRWPTAFPDIDWTGELKGLRPDSSVEPVTHLRPGAAAGNRMMRHFIDHGLERYHDDRNDPSLGGQSQLSPYLHFGQLAPQRLAWEAQTFSGSIKSQEAFLEELIVRRELSDNFCLYNDGYDSIAGFPTWARLTLEVHRLDPRPHLYSDDELERGETHDPLWNSAQQEMVTRGKMHGYMRMYWAKKMLEWTRSPEDALRIATHLNDKYSLDGLDPNGYAGIGWSIGGVHDRPWFEREIFGKIRYMSYDGCRRKFDVFAYIAQVKALAGATR